MNKTDEIFWLDDFKGEAQGGVFTRCNLNHCIKIINEKNAKVVGIKLNLDDEHEMTLELIIEKVKE